MNLIKVKNVNYLNHFIIQFSLNDSFEKEINLNDELWKTVPAPTINFEKFKKFELNPWRPKWESKADFAPEFLHNLKN